MALRAIQENSAYLACIKKQKQLLKSKGKDIVCCSLKMLDKLEEAEEKERQIEAKRVAIVATARPSSAYVLALSVTETDPLVGLRALSFPPKA
jgi:hypothetical protein